MMVITIMTCAGYGGQIRAKSSPCWSWARNHGFGSSGELEDGEDEDGDVGDDDDQYDQDDDDEPEGDVQDVF